MITGRERARLLAAVAAVVATYVEFLLFAQFGFLQHVRTRATSPLGVREAMVAMGLAGLAGSLVTAALLDKLGSRRLVLAGFAGVALLAPLSLAARAPAGLALAGAGIGAATAVLTVALAAGLRELLGMNGEEDWPAAGRRLGLAAGAGTGIAYGISNLPRLFTASPLVRALVPAVLCLGAALLLARVWPREEGPREEGREGESRPTAGSRHAPSPAALLDEALFHLPGFARVLASFLLLVWLDSAAFAVIQESPDLRALSWEGPHRLLLQGGVHLVAALAAGWLLGRGRLGTVVLATGGLFAIALPLLQSTATGAAVAAPLYAVGISLYSVALVFVPSAAPDGGGRISRAWRSGLLYGIAGWIGSALGVGMAEDLHRIPGPFVAGVVLALLLLWALPRARRVPPVAVGRIGRFYGGTLLLALLAFLVAEAPRAAGKGGDDILPGPGLAPSPAPGEGPTPGAGSVERGRRIYVAEGCIHCHSQYVRPGTGSRPGRDEILWGPHRPLSRPWEGGGEPVLIGNRRQGPDLANAGNRRTATWHRLHLLDPRSLSPGSRMPSYAHLFNDGSGRGEDLVAYVASLGAATARERYELTHPLPLPPPPEPPSAERGEVLFQGWCRPCHGEGGRGDGPFAPVFSNRPGLDLGRRPFWLIDWGPVGRGVEAEPIERGVARAVRFGIAGTAMPGHETLTDQQIADLAAFVLTLEAPAAPAAVGEGHRR